MKKTLILSLLSLLIAFGPVARVAAQQPAPAGLELSNGDHIAILGNVLPDRSQHFGWLETFIVQTFPQADLSFRNLSYSGDEVATWHRIDGFGTRDEWLSKVRADVIFCFYGNNESFKGYEGIAGFKADLDKFLKDSKAQNYSGKGSPRIVLFSPIAIEDLKDPDLPPTTDRNTDLQNYTAAMAEVAAANGVPFVNLFEATQKMKPAGSLTTNGLYLTEKGDKAVAEAAYKALFGKDAPKADEKLRAAIKDKNWQWHQRYRTVDGYNIYGGRSGLAYQAGEGKFLQNTPNPEKPYISNFQVMQEEMTQRDVMTANRDKRVWAIAKGGDLKVADDNLPTVTTVPTNMPNPASGKDFNKTPMTGMKIDPETGLVGFPGAEDGLKMIKAHSGMKVNLFADETMFPELVNPVQMAWDTRGRLWVAAWLNYPERTPTSTKGDSLLVFEDTNGDGVADKCTPFMDSLNCPTGFQFYKDGIILMQSPDLWYVRDTDGDGRGDTKERILMGLCAADSHHETNSLAYDNGGAIYPSDGVFHRTQVETLYGPVRNIDGGIYRLDLNTLKFDRYMPYGFANPHGKVFMRWGEEIITDATGNANYFSAASSGHISEPGKHPTMKQFWDRPARPCPGTGVISSRHFPDEMQGNFLNANVISFQGIYQVKVTQDGSGIKGETLEHLVYADPAEYPTFRPSCVSTGPDGALYFCDWANAIIGHMQHHLRDPNRDHKHGRIYRITYEGRPLLKPKPIYGQPIEALLDLLREPEDNVRERAKIELAKHDPDKVIKALAKWTAALDVKDPEFEHHKLEALWVHQWQNRVDIDLLKDRLSSPEPRARAAATRVLCYWRDHVPNALELLRNQINDEDPRVRLHAVRALSFFEGAGAKPALEIAYELLKKPTDYYLDYTFAETTKQLQSVAKETVLPSDPQVLAIYLSRASDQELTGMPNTEPVLIEKLTRPRLQALVRDAALTEIAKLHKTDRVTELISALKRLDAMDGKGNATAEELGKLLLLAPKADLAKYREAIDSLAKSASQPPVLRAAYAALVVGDGKPDTVWAATSGDAKARTQLIDGIGLIPATEAALRAEFQTLLTELLKDSATKGARLRAVLLALPLTGADHAAANFATVAQYLVDGTERNAAARALLKFPRASWPAEQAQPIIDSVLAYAQTVPNENRSTQEYVEIVSAAKEVSALLPAEAARTALKSLRAVSVSVFIVHTVHEQLRYDTSRIVVEAGKPFEIIFENDDVMPHNLIIVPPGKHMEIGMAAMTMTPDKLDKEGRAFVPKEWERRILAGTKLLEPGQKEHLKLDAPGRPGDYEFVCTFPGHSLIMWGTLAVVKDLDAAAPAPASN